ncbi:MAG: NAD+ synthase [Desulfovibrionaceae bacterium]|nr:NAD+ synthase [Desulfovibrionaceae bacterium]
MKVALIQSNPVTGALRDNMAALEAALLDASGQGADLCVAPELALCGPNPCDLLIREGFIADCRTVLQEAAGRLAAHSAVPPLLLGAPVANPVPQGKRLQNCAVLLHEGKVRVISRKVLIPSGGGHNDARYFEPGVACGVLHHRGWRFVITLGQDIWNDPTFWQGQRTFSADPVADFIAGGGADGLINLTALPYEQGLTGLHQRMLSHLARHYRIPVLAVNLTGGNDSLIYCGGSMALSANGDLLARAPLFRESLLMADVVGKGKGSIAAGLEREEELWQAIMLGTRDFSRKCGFRKAVLGLSGGVDSALVAALAAEALGPENVTGLLMPSPYSSQGSLDDAKALAENLGIAAHVLPVTPMLEAYEQVFSGVFAGGLAGVTEENIQARIRGSLLMAYSNRFGALLLSTGNKSEAAVGYGTLYGDLCGGLAPIADLYKFQVYALCRLHNAAKPRTAIPESILDKAPSAELRPGQRDSDSLPPYEILDPLLKDIVENGESLSRLVEKGYDQAMAREVLRLVRLAEFKRHQAPPALNLSRRGFGGNWDYPIANAYTSIGE